MAFQPECFYGTLQDALARADAIGADIVDGPFLTEGECDAWCIFTGTATTTSPPPACGSCDPTTVPHIWYGRLPGITDGTGTRCGIYGSTRLAFVRTEPGNCRWEESAAGGIKCGGGARFLALYYNAATDSWRIGLIAAAGGPILVDLYEKSDGSWLCTGMNLLTYIGTDNCCNWPATAQVWPQT